VLLHEQAHAYEKHSLDLLFIELMQIVFWFNPFIYLIKHSIKLNHEFLADRAVLNNGIETYYYQNILLAFSSNAGPPQLANSINYSSIKKRFTVMKTQTSKRAIWLRSIFLLPLLAILIYGFSTKEIIEIESTSSISQINAQKIATINTDKQTYDPKVDELKFRDNEIVKADLIPNGATTNEVQADKIITIKINNEQLVVNGKTTDLANFAKTLDKITKNWTKDEIANCRFEVIIRQSNDEFLDKLERQYQKTNIYKANPDIKLVPPPPPVPEVIIIEKIESDDVQIIELKIANNAIEKANYAVEVIEIKKAPNVKISEVMEIKVAPKVLIIDEIEPYENVSPPSPIATKVAVKLIESVNAVKADIPAPPPPPIVDFSELSANGATFYFEGKEITSKKALRILDKNKDINIEIIESPTEKPIVKLSKNQ
jgi:hypothetical protein